MRLDLRRPLDLRPSCACVHPSAPRCGECPVDGPRTTGRACDLDDDYDPYDDYDDCDGETDEGCDDDGDDDYYDDPHDDPHDPYDDPYDYYDWDPMREVWLQRQADVWLQRQPTGCCDGLGCDNCVRCPDCGLRYALCECAGEPLDDPFDDVRSAWLEERQERAATPPWEVLRSQLERIGFPQSTAARRRA